GAATGAAGAAAAGAAAAGAAAAGAASAGAAAAGACCAATWFELLLPQAETTRATEAVIGRASARRRSRYWVTFLPRDTGDVIPDTVACLRPETHLSEDRDISDDRRRNRP